MTVEAMSSLPLQAGGAVAAAAGRTALWVISAYMRQPLRNTAMLALVGFSALAGSNALYKQAHHHPAPLFGSFDTVAPALPKKVAPVMPAARPHVLDEPVSDETTGSVEAPSRVLPSIGKEDVAALQTKLAALGFFNGNVDGIFGPHTSKALKAFEASVGRPASGQLSVEAVALVRAAALPNAAAPEAPVAVAKAELPPVTAVTQPAADPLPAPAPLLPAAATAPANARSAIDVATAEPAQQAAPALALTDATTNTMTVPKRSVQTIAVRATPPAPAPAAQQMPSALPDSTDIVDPSVDRETVAAVQRGLNSLGFLHAPVDGTAGEATAKAIRNFEVYFNYNVTGRVTRQLVQLLEQNGAVI
ncbi:MAG TPA: peptidoglycan-binding domain-containing protein [Devosia sp.]|nr:peptidoglycan-binding domain-containing protein [Devosia sp.]